MSLPRRVMVSFQETGHLGQGWVVRLGGCQFAGLPSCGFHFLIGTTSCRPAVGQAHRVFRFPGQGSPVDPVVLWWRLLFVLARWRVVVARRRERLAPGLIPPWPRRWRRCSPPSSDCSFWSASFSARRRTLNCAASHLATWPVAASCAALACSSFFSPLGLDFFQRVNG